MTMGTELALFATVLAVIASSVLLTDVTRRRRGMVPAPAPVRPRRASRPRGTNGRAA